MDTNAAFEHEKYSLFIKRRFAPIFLATFLGAFNDNLIRSGLVVLIAYSASKGIMLPTRPEILVTMCSALLVAPMLLFSSLAGTLADKYEKSFLVVCTKIVELCIMCAAYYGFATQNISLLMVLLFISGTHTTFYSPIKFSILPDHLKNRELLAANGFMSGGSYLAVLLGLIFGGLLVELPGNIIGLSAIYIAVIGLLASLFIPKSNIAHPDAHMNLNLLKGTRDIILHACQERKTMYTIFAVSWFMLVSAVYMSQFANYAQSVVRGNNEVYILFLTLFSIGIAVGSLLCDTLLKGEISSKLTPAAALGISLFTYLMVFTTPTATHEGLLDASAFFATPSLWPVLACMMFVAISGGIYMVPLYALLQSSAKSEFRSRVIAASNVSDALFVTVGAVVCALMLAFEFSITDLFLCVATLNLVVAYAARKISS